MHWLFITKSSINLNSSSEKWSRFKLLGFNSFSPLITFLLEQLEKIDTGMDSIHGDMQIAEKALKGMELFCGIFPKFWKK